jgi:hypothetical protein
LEKLNSSRFAGNAVTVVKLPDVYVAPKCTPEIIVSLAVILTIERRWVLESKTNDPVAVPPSPKVTWTRSNVTTAACTEAEVIGRHTVASNATAPQTPKRDLVMGKPSLD